MTAKPGGAGASKERKVVVNKINWLFVTEKVLALLLGILLGAAIFVVITPIVIWWGQWAG